MLTFFVVAVSLNDAILQIQNNHITFREDLAKAWLDELPNRKIYAVTLAVVPSEPEQL